jgi:hypothetical protein
MTQGSNPLIPNLWESTAVLGIGLLALLLFVAVLVDIARARHLSRLAKAAWVLIALVFPLLGPALWFFIGRRNSTGTSDTHRTVTTS